MRERGVWPSDCDFCGTKNVLCRLVQKDDRYLWRCVADCTGPLPIHREVT